MADIRNILLQALIGLVVIGINVLFPDFTERSRYVVLAMTILLIGMPHGALDHWIDGKIHGWDPRGLNKVFYGWYLSLILIYSVFWIFFPFLSFMIFLVITLYHFGQADAERLNIEGWKYRAIQFSRGITVVGLIVFSDLEYASSIIAAVSDVSIAEHIPANYVEIIRWSLGACYPVIFCVVSIYAIKSFITFLAYFLDAIIVSALFLFSDPVWAFSAYFGLWHSYNHAKIMIRFLSGSVKSLNFGWFFKQSFVFSLLSYIGLLIVYNYLNAFGNEELLVSLLLVVISVLTLPHMIVVEKLYSVR